MTIKIPTSVLDATQGYPAGDGSAITNLLPLLHVREEQPSGTDGGANGVGWVERTLNAVKTNGIVGASLSGSQITLPAGTYYVEASAPAYGVNRHKIRFRNVTDAATVLVGISSWAGYNSPPSGTTAVLSGQFTIAASKLFELDHYTQTAQPSAGYGVASSSGEVEVYSEVKIWKIA